MDRHESTALLRRAKEGAPDALDALYERAAGKLLAFIRLRMGPSLRARLESRDILQATFLKSFEHLPQLEQSETGSFMAWLARIAENEIRDQADRLARRRRDARAEVRLETGDDIAATRARSALSRVILNEESERLEQALEALGQSQRDIIILRSLEELSFGEIAARLGKSEDACRMQFARAMTALTMRMTVHGAGSGT
jgi:RNA polymerase sigma-70 factor (ECF subfamily)